MSGRIYYIFGLQRSGTNFVEELIKLNYGHRKINNAAIWKHSVIPPEIENDTPLILIHKNPYTWIESICFRNEVDWKKKQTNYIITNESDEDLKAGKNGYSVKVLAQAYNDFHINWYERIKTANAYIIKYEDLLEKEGTDRLISDLNSKFNWKNSKNIIPTRVSQSSDYTRLRGEYYKTQTPRELTAYQIQAISNVITNEVFELNQYQKL